MSATLLKPRWEPWEKICLQQAYAQKIQHKIMATALGRTVTSVSKKIKNLGLRSSPKTHEHIKGTKRSLTWVEKTPQDLSKMLEILKTYAPLSCFQEAQLSLNKGCWSRSKLALYDDGHKEDRFDSLACSDVPFSYCDSLDFIPSAETISLKMPNKKVSGEPTYVPLYYVERWANLEGFHRIRGALQHIGLTYWKDGRHFSQTQLLMHVNRIRFEHNLRPIALIENDWESQLKAYEQGCKELQKTENSPPKGLKHPSRQSV